MHRRILVPWVFALAGCFSAPPVHPKALENNELCAQYISQGDLTKAMIYCDHGLEFSPFYADLWVNKGLIYLKGGQEDKAKDCFIKALRYNQEQAQAYNNLGVIYQTNKEYGKAHDNFQRALKVNPDYLEARYNLALTFMKMGDKEKSRKEYMTIIAVNPNLADPHHDLCVMALEEGKVEEAIEDCQKAVQLDPKYADAWLALGNAYMEAGKFSEAKEAFQSCIEAEPHNRECRNNLTIAARKGALMDISLKEMKETQEASGTPAGLLALARSYRDRGLKNEEERAYKKCLRLDPKYPLCHYGLFEVFSDQRRDKETMIACQNFLKYAQGDELPKEVETCERYVKQNE